MLAAHVPAQQQHVRGETARIEHDEVEKHQNMLKILDTDQIDINAAKPNR